MDDNKYFVVGKVTRFKTERITTTKRKVSLGRFYSHNRALHVIEK